MCNKKGFTLVEILLVVGIVALLAAISIPGYLQHTRRARASEAVATMTLVRQSLRDYFINNSAYYDIASGSINAQPTTGAAIDVGVAQFFSNSSFTVDGTSPSSARFTSPTAQNFIISVDGSTSDADCSDNDCALNAAAVNTYRLEMDNTGRIFISYNSGTNWTTF